MRLSDPAGPPPRVATRAGFLGPMLAALLLAPLAVPLAPAAAASARHRAAHAGTPAPSSRPAVAALTPSESVGQGPEERPVLRSKVGLNYAGEEFDRARDGRVVVLVLVDSTGTVSEARVVRPFPPFDSAAVQAARWWVFAPARDHGRPVQVRVAVTVDAHVPRDAEPLAPDVVALARQAEARGDLRGALDAWTGALARAGTHPMLQNEWAIRERIVRLAARMPKPPEVPPPAEASALGTHELMLRNIARDENEGYAAALDDVLREAPWYADAYRWRASARAASGQRDGAVRDVLCYRLAVRDSAERALAGRALAALAAADTLAALTMLKN